jgi:hypothetical protein
MLAGAAALMVAGGVSLASAPAASAASSVNGTISSPNPVLEAGFALSQCEWFTEYPTWGGAVYSYIPNVSATETFTMTASSFSSNTGIGIFTGTYSEGHCLDSIRIRSDDPSMSVPVTAGQQYTVVVWGCDEPCGPDVTYSYGTFTFEYLLDAELIGPPAPPSAAAVSAIPIPAWVQAYGRFGKDAPCIEGWSASWQSWAEPVTGGWACTRSIPSLG